MSTQREDIRRFKAFYPDFGRRRQVHYQFVHVFLRKYVALRPAGFFYELVQPELVDPIRYIHSRWMKYEWDFGLAPPQTDVFRRVSDLHIAYQILEGRPMALISMPAPEHVTCAHYVAVVLLTNEVTWEGIDREDPKARFFTLELTAAAEEGESELALVCEWKTAQNFESHVQLGGLPAPRRDAFVAAVAAALKNS
jgi:hypothetical protein